MMKNADVKIERNDVDSIKVFYSINDGELVEVKNGMLFTIVDDDAVEKQINGEAVRCNCYPVNDKVPQTLIAETIKETIPEICKNAMKQDLDRCIKMLEELQRRQEDEEDEQED